MKTIDALKATVTKFTAIYERGRATQSALAPFATITEVLALHLRHATERGVFGPPAAWDTELATVPFSRLRGEPAPDVTEEGDECTRPDAQGHFRARVVLRRPHDGRRDPRRPPLRANRSRAARTPHLRPVPRARPACARRHVRALATSAATRACLPGVTLRPRRHRVALRRLSFIRSHVQPIRKGQSCPTNRRTQPTPLNAVTNRQPLAQERGPPCPRPRKHRSRITHRPPTMPRRRVTPCPRSPKSKPFMSPSPPRLRRTRQPVRPPRPRRRARPPRAS